MPPIETTDTPVPQASWRARLQQILRWRRKPAETPLDPDQTVTVQRPSRAQPDAAAAIDDAPAPKLSLLARLKSKIRRQPKPEPLADALNPAPLGERKRDRATTANDENTAEPSDAEADTPKIGWIKRGLTKLSNKWVWIPSISVVLLALIGALVFMFLQSAQEKTKLQAQLQAVQKKLDQKTVVAKKAGARAATPMQADAPVHTPPVGSAVAKTSPGANSGDCLITDKESVSRSLKDCIESFNNTMASARPAKNP